MKSKGAGIRMRKYVFIGLGGTLGAVLRFLIKGINLYHYNEKVPLNTLFVNVAGCFILALVLTAAYEIWEFDAAIRLGIATGFLGAFTTFSTLCKETAGLLYQGYYFPAIAYVILSAVFGLAAVYLGMISAREVVAKLVKKDKEELDDTKLDTEGGVE